MANIYERLDQMGQASQKFLGEALEAAHMRRTVQNAQYNDISMPARPYDKITAGEFNQDAQNRSDALLSDYYARESQRNLGERPHLADESIPDARNVVSGESPADLGIGPSPEWLAEQDAREQRIAAHTPDRSTEGRWKSLRERQSTPESSAKQAERWRGFKAWKASQSGAPKNLTTPNQPEVLTNRATEAKSQ